MKNLVMDARYRRMDRSRKRAERQQVEVKDGWENFLTGLGQRGRDKRQANYASWGLTLPEPVAEDIFASDAMARRIVEILPNDAMRAGIEFKQQTPMDPLRFEMDRLQVEQRIQEAWIFARLYGGGGIFINDGTPKERLNKPLDPRRIDKIMSFSVLHRWEMWAWATDLQRDMSKPDFGSPRRYHLFPRAAFGQVAMECHASRIIRFDGRKLPRLLHIRNNFWGDSILTPLYEALGDYRMSTGAIATVLQDFRLLVHKIKGLTEIVNSGNEQQVIKRVELMNQARSIMGTIVLDDEDDMDFHSATMTGVAELFEKLKESLGALTDIPHSILFNEGPGAKQSMGSSGDHEEQNWYNTVSAYQVNYLKPRQDEIFKLIFAQQNGPFHGQIPEAWEYEFKPLGQVDEKEKADTYLKNAQGDEIYMNSGVATPAQVQTKRFPDLAVNPDPIALELNLQPLSTPDPGDGNVDDPAKV